MRDYVVSDMSEKKFSLDPHNGDCPFLQENRRLVFENTRFNVFADRLSQLDGQRVESYMVVQPKEQTACGLAGAMVLPIREGQFFLLNIFRHPVNQWLWEVPGGFIDEKESPEQSAARELTEETGLVCEPHDLHSLGVVCPTPGLADARIALFYATNCHYREPPADREMGIVDGRWFSADEMAALVLSPYADTVSMLLYYRYLATVG